MEYDEIKASLVLLAGGKGLRVGYDVPKQFIDLGGTFIAEYALKPFLEHSKITEYVVVCDPIYRPLFGELSESDNILFADPGAYRQDSLQNGLNALTDDNPLVFVHDAARPFFDSKYVNFLFESAKNTGSAVIGIPASSTLKEVDENECVQKTLDRSMIWEAQTPQVAFKKMLLKGIEKARRESITVTDEASLIELLGLPIQMIKGDPFNFKVTLPGDLKLAKAMTQNEEIYNEKILDQSRI